MINTLSDAVGIVEFLIAKQGKSVEDAIEEAEVPLHLREQLKRYFEPPLDIISPEMLLAKDHSVPRCNPEVDSMQQYFGALQRFLIEERGRSKSVVGSLSEISLNLVRQLPKPDAADSFQVRGLVVGHVQSGKTAAMAALIARAADEGYKLFIVLGGFWKDLRAQTQKRLDQEIVGESDDPADGPYVEHDESLPRWVRLTGSGLEGDFKPGPNDLNPTTPKLAVIKKNKRIDSLIQFLEKAPFDLKELPALIIDDESDQGSIDTNYGKLDDDGEQIDPSATNRRIRALLRSLPKSAYVGFTATPFANVLIDASSEDDLYPRDFIATLPEPAGYFGPRKLFGLGMSPSDLSSAPKEKPPINLIRTLKDYELDAINSVAKSGGDCPPILSDAMLAFVLSSCARLKRGQERDHYSMLVHTTQYTEPHRTLGKAIRDELQVLRQAAAKPKMFPEVLGRARTMWEKDFMPVTESLNDPTLPTDDFDTIWKFAKALTESIEVVVVNSGSEDVLDYRPNHFKRYIVVGGNRLSRGLTLEGLSVSVFTRSASQYDTLLQMGRWFGYRTNYHDLTRIYVDSQLEERFADLARIEEELRADLSKYAEQPDPPTPMDLKPMIRTHPTMAVTARMKYGAGKRIRISFDHSTQQTVSFPVENKSLLRKNLESGQAFINQLPSKLMSASDEGMHIWTDVPAASILEFLNSYEFGEARSVNRENLTSYIERLNSNGELVHWDVVLPRGSQYLQPYTWSQDILTRKVTRAPMTPKSIKVLSSPSDEKTWNELTGHGQDDPTRACIMLYMIDRESDKESTIKFFPNRDNAEDILGLYFIFPGSRSHETIEYVSQP